MAKRCTRCLKWKQSDEFYKDRTKLDGLKSQCKDCRREYKREYRARKRSLAKVRLRRAVMRLWQSRGQSRRRRLRASFSPGFRRWRQKVEARQQAYLNAVRREIYACDATLDAIWHNAHPEVRTARRHAQRAASLNAPVNDLEPEEWKWLLEVYGHRCAYCGQGSSRLTPDHVTPLSHGGHNTLGNIVPACQSCNSQKGARTPAEAQMSFAIDINIASELEQLVLI